MSYTTDINIVVGSLPELSAALESSGVFASVVSISSTGELRDLVPSLPKDKGKLIFLFASSMVVDTPQNLEFLAGRLSSTGWKVVIMATSALAKEIVTAHPAAGYLEPPFSINQVLAAVAGLGFPNIQPVEGGFSAVYSKDTAPGAWVSTPAQEQPSVKPQAPPSQPPRQQQPISGSAWVRPADPASEAPQAQPPVPARPQQQAPTQQPRPAQPAQQPSWSTVPQQPTTWTPGPAQPESAQQRQPTTQGTAPLARPIARPSQAAPAQAQPAQIQPVQQPAPQPGFTRPNAPGPIGRRVGTHQDFAPSGPSMRRRGHVITIASPKGGTGKSSLSANLAVYLGLSLRGTGRRVALIDANFQQADTGKLLNVYTPNISNILKDESSMVPERIEQYMVERPNLNTSFLLGPATPRDATPAYFNAKLYSQVLSVLRKNFDYILIDTPVAELYHDILRGFALPQADYIVVPITPAIHTLMNADGWLRMITQPRHQGGDEVNPAKIGIVLNQAQDGVDCDEDEVKRELYAWTFIGSVPMTKEWLKSNNNNEFVATKNIPEISNAFANILYSATGEEVLLQGLVPQQEQGKKGLLSKLRRRQ